MQEEAAEEVGPPPPLPPADPRSPERVGPSEEAGRQQRPDCREL